MPNRPTTRRTSIFLFVLGATLIVAACGTAASPSPSPSPNPTPNPTPTPITQPVTTPEEAAAAVIASDPRFSGIRRFDPNLIGASAWWTAEPAADAGYVVTIIIGWGDCPAGCINKHEWRFDVRPDGTLRLLQESGEPLPAGTLPPG